MLTITAPYIKIYLERVQCGLQTFKHKDGKLLLTIKIDKESILTAKLKYGFSFFINYFSYKNFNICGITTAFFDDAISPLTITTPIYNDDFLIDFKSLISQDSFNCYFFDLNNRELLAYSCKIKIKNDVIGKLNSLNFLLPKNHNEETEILEKIRDTFSKSLNEDNSDEIKIEFQKPLMPNDILISDLSKGEPDYYSLEQKEPGYFQEKDIAKILSKHFPEGKIFVNPYRIDQETEFCDICLDSDNFNIYIQAKDSPNTKDILDRNLERKIKSVSNQIDRAYKQVLGCKRYYESSSDDLRLKKDNNIFTIVRNKKAEINLIIVKEIFEKNRKDNSYIVKDSYNKRFKRILIDFGTFYNMLFTARNKEDVIAGFNAMYNIALKDGYFRWVDFINSNNQ